MSNALLIIILLYYYTDIQFNACVGIHLGMYTNFMLQLHDSRIEYERSLTDLHTQNIQKDREHHVEISDMTSRHEHMVNQLRDKHEQMIEQLKHNVRQIEHDNNVSYYQRMLLCNAKWLAAQITVPIVCLANVDTRYQYQK